MGLAVIKDLWQFMEHQSLVHTVYVLCSEIIKSMTCLGTPSSFSVFTPECLDLFRLG